MINKAYVTLFISVISVSFAAIFIVSCSAHPLSIAFYRLLFTTLIIIPFVIFNKKTRKELINLSYITIIIMAGIGFILAAHFSLWITSLKFTSVASSVILVTAHPFLVGPVSHYLFKEKLSVLNIIGIILSVFGVIILVYGNHGLSSITMDSLEGNILALFGGIAAGFYILGGRKMRKKISVTSYAFVVYSVSTIALFIICLLFNAPIFNISIQDYQIILLMAIISGIFGHTLYNWSLKYIKTSIVSVALLGEPFASTLFAYAIPWVHQVPSEFSMLGGTIIIVGIFMITRKQTTLVNYH